MANWIYALYDEHVLFTCLVHWVYPGLIPYALGTSWIYNLCTGRFLYICLLRWSRPGYRPHALGMPWIHNLYTGPILNTPLYVGYILDVYLARWTHSEDTLIHLVHPGCIVPYVLDISWIYMPSTLGISWICALCVG